jgi:hypothetical protein
VGATALTARGPNLDRRKDLERSIKAAGPKDELDLQTLANMWGVAKPTFVNTLRQVERMFDVPRYREAERGVHMYPARKMLEVMLAYEKRNDQVALDRQEKAARILGQHRVDQAAMLNLPINELAQLNRLAVEIEGREREQRMYIHQDEVSQVVGEIFSSLSGYLSQLEVHIDPNGLLPAKERAVLREGGTGLALRIHGEIKDMLNPDAQQPAKRSGSRKPNGRARRASSRRKGRGRGSGAAR